MVKVNKSGKSYAGKRPDKTQVNLSNASVVVMGGGTGSSMVLRSLKGRVGKLTSIVTTADDGGATGILRDQFGNLPAVGDALQATMSLIDESGATHAEIMQLRDWLGYRFANHHKIGNDMLQAGMIITGSLTGAVNLFSRWFRTLGEVYPVSEDSRRLVLKLSDGRVIKGEHRLDDPELEPDIPYLVTVEVDFDKPNKINPIAKKAIKEADLVILAPGSLYGSTGAVATRNIIGMKQALKSAQVLAIINIMNDRHTTGLDVTGYVDRINGMAGANIVNWALFNTGELAPSILTRYAKQKETPVVVDLIKIKKHQAALGYQTVGADLVSRVIPPAKNPKDETHRALARHDQTQLYRAIDEMFHRPANLTWV